MVLSKDVYLFFIFWEMKGGRLSVHKKGDDS